MALPPVVRRRDGTGSVSVSVALFDAFALTLAVMTAIEPTFDLALRYMSTSNLYFVPPSQNRPPIKIRVSGILHPPALSNAPFEGVVTANLSNH